MARRRTLVLLALGAVAVARADAAACASAKGRAAPNVTTIFASPDDPADAAWVLRPDCALEVIEIKPAEDNGAAMLNCSDRGIAIIESLPSNVARLHFEYNAVQEADLSSYKDLYHIILAWSGLKTIDNFNFPSSLGILDLDGNELRGIAKGTVPSKVNTMYMAANQITSLDNFSLPAFLTELNVQNNSFTTVNCTLPNGLEKIFFDASPQLKKIENMTMPNSLTTLACPDCPLETFRGVQLSTQLESIDFTGATLTELEIREADVSILKEVTFSGDVAQKTCSDAKATLRGVQASVTACVITDAVFAAKYKGETLSSGSASSGGVSTTAPTSPSSSPSSSSSSTTVILVVVVACVVCVVVGAVLYRQRARANRNSGDKDIGDKYVDATTVDAAGSSMPTAGSQSTNTNSSREYLSNDIRNDEALITYRIAYEDVQILEIIGKGGFGIVHLAKFRGRRVAIKQMLPDRAKDMRVVRSFMDEIRLCASLEHPRIVEFIGLRWSTLQDIAVVNEYMEGGDLHAVLQKQQTFDPVEWFERSATLKAKSSLALDVVVALVYLHSFDQPIIHRDLKTRNVLLNGDGDAKLSDFGTSREALLDETMTGEIGTLAWIAPEVLRGERYSEKADIYSLGVLLVELDTASHPYRNAISEQNGSPISNTRIALMVSAGKLAPSVTPSCPPDIAAVIMSCLNYDQHARPSAMEIHYELRKIVRADRTG